MGAKKKGVGKKAREEKQLTLQVITSQGRKQNLMIDWSHFLERTDSGTLLVQSTLRAIELDLDQFCFYERTGMPMPKGQRNHIVPWKSVLSKLDMTPNDLDRKKLLSALDQDLNAYEEAQASKRGGSLLSSLDPKELKDGTANLHKLFLKYKSEEQELTALAAFYMVDFGGDLDQVKNLVRAVVRHPSNQKTFSIGAGGSPRVRRLTTAQGKKTGLNPFDLTRKPRRSSGSQAEA